VNFFVIRLPENAFAKWLLLLFLVQQGVASVAMAASEMQHRAARSDVAAMEHHCERMGMQHDVYSGTQVLTEESLQGQDQADHEHQDCIAAGCDDCVGCVACVIGYRNSIALYLNSLPVVSPIYIAVPIPEPDLLYRPPISN
jgi:hypothetical protein